MKPGGTMSIGYRIYDLMQLYKGPFFNIITSTIYIKLFFK